MSNQFDELYVDEEYGAEHEQAFIAALDNRLKELHTCLPGIIQSYNPATNTATVQPAIQRVFTADGPKNLPLIFDVLVSFPGGGDFTITFPVRKGDECILVFSERAIDNWYKSGSTQTPSVFRMHNLSDAFAQVGIRSLSRKLADIQMDGMELRNEDRSVAIKIKADGIAIKGNVTIDGTLDSTGDIHAIGTSLHTHEHGGVQSGASLTTAPV